MPTFTKLTIKKKKRKVYCGCSMHGREKNAHKIRVRKPERTRGLCETYEYMETQFNLTQQRESGWNEIIWLGTLSTGGCCVNTARSRDLIALNGWITVSTEMDRMRRKLRHDTHTCLQKLRKSRTSLRNFGGLRDNHDTFLHEPVMSLLLVFP
jgi:hypothetical protein